jgi:hypothetical protein
MTCQYNKSEKTHPTGLLQPLPISEKKWESISMEFITGLPKVQGIDCIYVVVDQLTKFAHLFSISSEYKATQLCCRKRPPPPPSVSEADTVQYDEMGTVRPRNIVGRTVRRLSKGKRCTVRLTTFRRHTVLVWPSFRDF